MITGYEHQHRGSVMTIQVERRRDRRARRGRGATGAAQITHMNTSGQVTARTLRDEE